MDDNLPSFDDIAAVLDTLDAEDKANVDPSELQSLSPKTKTASGDAQREGAIASIVVIYGDRTVAIAALDAIQSYAPNNIQHAVAWIAEHPQEVQAIKASVSTAPKSTIIPLQIDGERANTTTTETTTTTSGSTASNNRAQASNDDDGIECQEKCNECMAKCGVICNSGADGMRENYDNMSRAQRRICWGVCGFFCCFGLLLTVILIPISMRKVEFDEYAIKYDGLTRQESEEEYGEGRYLFTPRTKLFLYDALIQKLSLYLDCLTKDGIVMEITVDIQYFIPANNVFEIWDNFGKENQIDDYFALVAADSVRDAIGSFKAASFYKNRYGIQQKIEEEIETATEAAGTYLSLNNAVLSRYSFPTILKAAISEKRAAENEIEIAENQRDGNLTDAETNFVVAKVYAQQIAIQTQAEVDSLTNEATAHATAVRARFELLSDLFVTNQEMLNFTGGEFIDYWLTAFVLHNATEPITNTGSDVVYSSRSRQPRTTTDTVNDTMTTNAAVTTAAAQTTKYFTTAGP